MKVVICLGGSVLVPSKPDLGYAQRFSGLMIKMHKEGHKIMIVVGGGRTAKEYISLARELGASEDLCDKIGILATRMNASLLLSVLKGHALENVAKDFKGACENRGIFVMGGTEPGHTTDAVAAMLASHCNADLMIIATNVDGVYDSDPKKNLNAKKFDRISGEKLLELVYQPAYKAGVITVVDQKAAKIILENKIKTVVLNGRDLESLENAIKGGKHSGTVVE